MAETKPGAGRELDELESLAGQVVLLDTSTPLLYVGTLREWGEHFVTLVDADAHDTTEGRSGKDLYALEARRHGVQKNRREVHVRKAFVVSVSLLRDVVMY